MAEVGFYHLTRSPLEEALPRLVEKAYAAGQRVLVRVGGRERLEALDRALWTYDAASFLPHGARGEAYPESQPIYLTDGLDNPNGARLLILADGADVPDLAAFDRCLDLFDGGDPEAVARARERWRQAASGGHATVYWQQNERGGWARASEAGG